MIKVHTGYFNSPIGLLELKAKGNSLIQILFSNEQRTDYFEGYTEEAARQLNEYFNMQRELFNLNIAAEGTKFQMLVWGEVLKIPLGETFSYKHIAELLGNPGGYRAVGNANSQNKIPIIIPCHRVIGEDDSLTGYAGGINKKKWLLEHEKAIVNNTLQLSLFE